MKSWVVFYRQKGCRGLADECLLTQGDDPQQAVAKAIVREFGVRKLIRLYAKGDERPVFDALAGQAAQPFLPGLVEAFEPCDYCGAYGH